MSSPTPKVLASSCDLFMALNISLTSSDSLEKRASPLLRTPRRGILIQAGNGDSQIWCAVPLRHRSGWHLPPQRQQPTKSTGGEQAWELEFPVASSAKLVPVQRDEGGRMRARLSAIGSRRSAREGRAAVGGRQRRETTERERWQVEPPISESG